MVVGKGLKKDRTSKTTSQGSKHAKTNTKPGRPSQQKSKRALPGPKAKRQKTYTAEELNIPKLNGIVPVGVQKAKGKKKGKVFVDDPQSMMTILAIVNAEKEGQIESKVVKARQMEEIREARRQEAERKQQSKQSTLEAMKESVKRKKKAKYVKPADAGIEDKNILQTAKRVSFAE